MDWDRKSPQPGSDVYVGKMASWSFCFNIGFITLECGEVTN
jgi:hypothetical protein